MNHEHRRTNIRVSWPEPREIYAEGQEASTHSSAAETPAFLGWFISGVLIACGLSLVYAGMQLAAAVHP